MRRYAPPANRKCGGAENALRARPKDKDALKDEQIKKLKQKVDELVLDLDVLKEATVGRAPSTERRGLALLSPGEDRLAPPGVHIRRRHGVEPRVMSAMVG